VTSVLIAQIRDAQIAQVGQSFQTLAEINAERIANTLAQQVDALVFLGRQETVLLDGLERANTSYPAAEAEIRDLLLERERRWYMLPESDPFILQYRNNPQTLALSKFRGADLLHDNLLLIDRYGGLVAAQGKKPLHYSYGNFDWWQAAWNNGLGGRYVRNVPGTPNGSITSIFIAVAVLNPQTNQTVGVLASTYRLDAIQRDIQIANTQAIGEMQLTGPNGIVIAGANDTRFNRRLGADALFSETATSNWRLGHDGQGRPAVLAESGLNATSSINTDLVSGLNWRIVLSGLQDNALAGVTQSTRVATLVALLTLTLVVLAAIATARVITRPIAALTQTASAISAGRLDERAEPVGPVELVTLAEAFNTLTAQLRSLINNLQDQVAQRTAQLERRVEEMAMLNRITQAVASARDLNVALEIVAQEMVLFFDVRNTGIALLNPDRTQLTVVADYTREKHTGSTVGTVIPVVDNPSSQQVIETGRPLAVSNVQSNPLTGPIHELMQRRRTQTLMIIPLLSRGQVIGTVGLATDQAERAFTPAELALAETISGQIAGAIENVNLLSARARQIRELDAIGAIGQLVSASFDLDEMVRETHKILTRAVRAAVFYVALYDPHQDRLTRVFLIEDGRLEEHGRVDLWQGHAPRRGSLIEWVLHHREPLLFKDEVYQEALAMGLNPASLHGLRRVRSWIGAPLLAEDGAAIGVLSVQDYAAHVYDEQTLAFLNKVTSHMSLALQKVQLFNDLQRAKEAAEAANASKSVFLSNVSHELRTPLTSVLGFAKIIKKRLDETIRPHFAVDDPKVGRALRQVDANIDIIVSEGERLTALINNVLDLAKIEAGKIEWTVEPVSIARVIEQALAASAALVAQKELALIEEVADELPQFMGDHDRFVQVILNLISNAVKFTEHGSVTCRAERRGHEIIVSVIDTGVGISAGDLPKVFEQFVQVGDTLTGKPQGTGLGLAICRQIVEHHGGRIWVESEGIAGRGSTFSFSIPIAPAPSGASDALSPVKLNDLIEQLKSEVAAATSGMGANSKSILVVDDEAPVRELLRQELGTEGYLVVEAQNGFEALEAVKRQRPDLVILDVRMPGISGFDVAAALKNDAHTILMPIIILSIVQDKERGYRLGVDRYLTKPIDTPLLLKEIEALLSENESGRRVMVVDEDATAVETLSELLRRKGYHVSQAVSAQEAIDKVNAERPDIIFLNAQISAQYDMMQALRFDKALEDLVFLFYTHHPEPTRPLGKSS
jgi:signal transduction histidine kinase/DNA-binding response OmpR family regulator